MTQCPVNDQTPMPKPPARRSHQRSEAHENTLWLRQLGLQVAQAEARARNKPLVNGILWSVVILRPESTENVEDANGFLDLFGGIARLSPLINTQL